MDASPDCSRAAGVLRRSISLSAEGREVRGVVCDDYHHFRVTVRHDGKAVTSVASQTLRIPWTACAFAGDDWSRFIGAPLDPRASAIARYVEMRLYCTHMYELAGLAMAAAARGITRRHYEMAVPYGERRGEAATLTRDGLLHLSWRTDGTLIQDAPPPLAGARLREGFAAWAAANLDAEEGEAALVLRRAVIISSGRTTNLDAVKVSYAGGGCYTTQPARAATAYRVIGSTQDFEQRPEAQYESDQDWLDFRVA
jgi:hypothetical protein